MLNHSGTRTLETRRLILRRHGISDADDMYKNWVTDPEVSRFWTWLPHKNIGETKALLAGWMGEYARPDYYHWIIVLKHINEAIGYIYLTAGDAADAVLSVHYALGRGYWNRGIMTEACLRVIDYAFAELNAEKIESWHHIDNPASGRVMEKSGMKHVKTQFRPFPDCERLSGSYRYYEIANPDLRN